MSCLPSCASPGTGTDGSGPRSRVITLLLGPQEVGLGSLLPNLGTVISYLGRGTSTLESCLQPSLLTLWSHASTELTVTNVTAKLIAVAGTLCLKQGVI